MKSDSAVYIRVKDGVFEGCGGYMTDMTGIKGQPLFKVWKGDVPFTINLKINQYEIIEPHKMRQILKI